MISTEKHDPGNGGKAQAREPLASDPELEPTSRARPASSPVVHVVFVPGFGGFDALGTVEYYPGTTEVAARWRALAHEANDRVVLHYFDNLPTAGVKTRAERLLRYLEKRVARNEFRSDDQIALVGHSTGGLDIRQLLKGLLQASASDDDTLKKQLPVAWQQFEQEYACAEVRAARALLKRISRVVFLSVPNRGTNIANWVRAWSPVRIPALSFVSFLVDVSDVAGFQRVDIALAKFLERLRAVRPQRVAIWQALLDTWLEDAQRTSADPVLAARGREALAQLTLYLSQTHGDFLAIDDLAATDPKRSKLKGALKIAQGLLSNIPRSEERDLSGLACASEPDRALERALWDRFGIITRSYATRGGAGVPREQRHERRKIPTLRALLAVVPDAQLPKTDWLYRLVYTACAFGPFALELEKQRKSTEPDHSGSARQPDGMLSDPIESWQNDGIVNTASMLWPNGEATLLVDADHGDIIGHYTPTIDPDYSISQQGRKYRSYDIFGSNSGFTESHFEQVWQDIFQFCAQSLPVTSRAGAQT